MDFEVVGLDNLVSSNSATAAPSNNGSFALDSTTAENSKPKWYGSGFLKQERAINEDDFRDFKVAKTSSCGETLMKIPLQRSNTTSLSEGHQQMLSFSSPTSQTVTFPYYHPTSTGFSRNTGYGSTGINAASMQGVVSGFRGPFTPSQWMELEHQALIYKYITANVPIPSYLLNPIRKAFDSAGFSTFSGLRSNSLGWGGFHLGFSNTDPEPGRCRRTDGKKWRCSRDAVADQKYCERHMNRGRHRSRKPVEGQSGHSATGLTTTNGKPPMATSSSTSVVPPGGVSNSLGLSHHHQLSNLQPGSSNHLPGIANINRSLQDKENADEGYRHTTVLSMTSPKVSLKDNQFSVPKQQNAYEESSRQEFGLVCSDSLLNPLDRSSSLVNCRNYGTHDNLNHHENKSQHALRQFMDNWPKNQSEQRTAISWPDVDLQPDRTQLSISIPMVTSDFMSSTSSPTNEKLTASPLRLSQELKMGLGVGTLASEQNQRQTNWVPISWEPSMGGPLGEVLHTTSNSTGDCKNAKPLNLMESWDNSPRLASSPTGVLQRGAFGSLSNSSAGSSPRAESSKTLDGASLCNGLIGSGLMNPSLPAL
ncbi:UNVERIFIED_CONTAM: Growth-regulating factor 6 [Sesamum calycinum]|uniref:Growth-regulating factor n=1 Tax=Sesamum calycinum TaxID=2727403 RepID=A0AAW2QN20_9LAMI